MISSTTNTNPDFGFLICLRRTWQVARDHWFVLMLAAFLRDLITVLGAGLVFSLFLDLKGWNLIIASVAGCFIWSGFQAGYLKFCLNIYRHGQVNWKDLFSGLPLGFHMLFANVCYWLAVIFGLVLLVVPGLILAAKFSLYGFAMVDQKLGALKSLTVSSRMVKGFMMYAVGLLLIYFVGTLGGYLSLAFQSLLAVSLCVLYEHIRTQEPN